MCACVRACVYMCRRGCCLGLRLWWAGGGWCGRQMLERAGGRGGRTGKCLLCDSCGVCSRQAGGSRSGGGLREGERVGVELEQDEGPVTHGEGAAVGEARPWAWAWARGAGAAAGAGAGRLGGGERARGDRQAVAGSASRCGCCCMQRAAAVAGVGRGRGRGRGRAAGRRGSAVSVGDGLGPIVVPTLRFAGLPQVPRLGARQPSGTQPSERQHHASSSGHAAA